MGFSLNFYFFKLNNEIIIKVSKLAIHNKKSPILFYLFGYDYQVNELQFASLIYKILIEILKLIAFNNTFSILSCSFI